MVILKAFVPFLILAVLLVSCTENSRSLDYQDVPFAAGIAVSIDEINATATLIMQPAPDETGKLVRNFTLSFSEPSSLCGITVERKGGEAYVRLNGLALEATDIFPWQNLISLFSIDGTPRDITLCELGGARANRLNVTDPSGNDYIIYLSEVGEPLRISSSHATVDILWYRAI